MFDINYKNKERLILILIIIFGAFLYLYRLSNVPPGLYLDEAGTGYNAYSILKTGKDEYGKFIPIAFKLYGSYTPPLYIYLSVPIIAIFDLSIFSTRLLSVISGIISIPIFFLIIKELKFTRSKYTPLITTAFYSISPWLVYFSRLGYEQNLAFCFFLISVLFMLKSLKNPKLFVVAIPFLSLTTYADYPQRVTSPLFFLTFTFLFFKKYNYHKYKRNINIGILIAFLIQLPNFYLATTPSFYTKTGLFYSDVISTQSNKIAHYLPPIVASVLAMTREFSSQFISYLSPRSLFFLADSDPQRSAPGISVLYSWMLIPYLIGFYIIIKKRKLFSSKIILLLLLITPIAGAIAKQPFHTQRTLSLLLPVSLLMAAGIDQIINSVNFRLWFPIICLIFIYSLTMLWRSYFVLLPQQRATVWAFEFAPLSQYIKEHPEYTFVIDQSVRTKPENVAYSQLVFYLKLDPKKLQADQDPAITKDYYHNLNINFVHKFNNIETRQIDWADANNDNFVLVGDTAAISDLQLKLHNLMMVLEIKDPNDQVVLRAFKTNSL